MPNKKRLNSSNINQFNRELWSVLDEMTNECVKGIRKLMRKDNSKVMDAYLLFRQCDGVCQSKIKTLEKIHNVHQLQFNSKGIYLWNKNSDALMTHMNDLQHCLSILHLLDCTIQKRK